MQSTIVLPNDTAVYGQWYYVLISIWDQKNSYNQIGFASINGTWQVMYSAGENCFTGPFYQNQSAYTLKQNVQYTFQMAIQSGGKVFFGAYLGTSSTLM